MKLKNMALLLALAVILSSITAYFYASYFGVERVIALDIKVRLDGHFGLNADNDAINFGRVVPGSSSERVISANNSGSKPLKVTIRNSGSVARWVAVSDNNFIMAPMTNKSIVFRVSPEKGAAFGNYTGTALITFRRTI